MREVKRTALFVSYCERGDGEALAALFDDLAPELHAVARHLAPSPGEAEDLVAATFLRAMSKRATFHAEAAVVAWMHGILWREAVQARRRAARRVEPERLAERRTETPGDELEAREARERVDGVLARLPRATAELLRAYLLDEVSPGELARRSGRSPATVRSQIRRGLARLRRALPVGLAPLGGFAPAPPDFSAVRERVLDEARAQGASFLSGASTLSTAFLGVTLVTKTFLIAASTAALTFVCGWRLGVSSAEAPDPSRSAPVAAATPRALPVDIDAVNVAAPAAEEARAPLATPTERSTQQPFDEVLAYWIARFGEAPDDWRHGWKVAGEIAELEPGLALALMRGALPTLGVAVKEQVQKPFVFDGGHAAALGVLDLALRDAELSVQGRALTYLEWYAFEDFEADYGAALRWMDTWRDVPVGEALSANAQAFVQRIAGLSTPSLFEQMERFELRLRQELGGDVDLATQMRAAGIEALLARAMTQDDPQVARNALEWAREVEVGEPWLRAHVLPILRETDTPGAEDLTAAVLHGLARPECAWASGEVFAWLERQIEDPRSQVSGAASAIAAYGDPASVPRLIALMQRDTTGRSIYDIGYSGLGKLTGVDYHESHDAAWWQQWWIANQARFR